MSSAHGIDYNGRHFGAIANASNGEVSRDTVFSYNQRGNVVWATYEGGQVEFGTLVAAVDDAGKLDMRYSHISADGSLQTGICLSTPEVLEDGRLRLHENWRWTSGDGSKGTSVIEEIRGA